MTSNNHKGSYIAVIGDIRGSRELNKRDVVQKEFKDVVNRINNKQSKIASKATITTGDEFQILLTDADEATRAMITVTEQMFPTKLRFGIGYGGLNTELNPEQAIGMDGECFYNARSAINLAKEKGAWVRVEGWPAHIEEHVNSMFDVVQCIREDWTESQAKYALEFKNKGTQKAVAESFDVVKSTISQSLKSGHVREVHAAEKTLATLLHKETPS
jgi:hypothetical protein